MGRRLSPFIAVVGLAGAGAWFALAPPKRGAAGGPDSAALAADIAARIRETIAGVQARADTLAQLPRLGLAVATDEQTVRDLTTEELAFRTKPGEHIEIAQVARQGGRDGEVHSLLRLPGDVLPLAMGSLGPHLLVSGGRLHVVVYVPVTPRDRQGELRGAIAVAQAADLSSFAQRFAASGLVGRIEVGGKSVALDGREPPIAAASVTVALSSAAPEPVSVAFVGATGGLPGGDRPIAGPVALLIASLVAAGLLRRQRQATQMFVPPASPSPLLPMAGNAMPTPPSGARLPATPTPPAGLRPASSLTPPTGATSTPTPPAGVKPTLAPTPPAGAAVVAPPPVPGGLRRSRVFTPAVGVAWNADSPPSFTPAELPMPPAEQLLAPLSAPLALPFEAATAEGDGVPGPALFGDESWARASTSAATKLVRPPAPRSVNESLRRTSTLPSYLFEVADGVEPRTSHAAPAEEDALGREYRELYVEFIRMRRTCREPVDNLDPDHFVAALRRQHDELRQQYGQNKSIRFRLGFHNGKAVIRFVVA